MVQGSGSYSLLADADRRPSLSIRKSSERVNCTSASALRHHRLLHHRRSDYPKSHPTNRRPTMSKKRSADGKEKSTKATPGRATGKAHRNTVPRDAKAPPVRSGKSKETQSTREDMPITKRPKLENRKAAASTSNRQTSSKPSDQPGSQNSHPQHQKQPRLPDRTLHAPLTNFHSFKY